jgi:hypothetical protein
VNGWLPSEVKHFKGAMGRCGTLYADKVANCLQRHKLDLQLSSNLLQDIQNSQSVNTAGCPGCRVGGGQWTTTTGWTSGGGGNFWGWGSNWGGGFSDDDDFFTMKRRYAYRNGASGDAIQMTHTIQEQAVLEATDKSLQNACRCFANAFQQTVKECQISHITCKTPQTCNPELSCPLVQPTSCSLKSASSSYSQTPSYSCDVDYCTEGTGTCDHSWWATATNLPAVPATCGDNADHVQNDSNQEKFGLGGFCQVLRPNKRSTTYTVVMTTTSSSQAGLSAGAIAGIVIACVCVVIVLVAIIGYFVHRNRHVEYQ